MNFALPPISLALSGLNPQELGIPVRTRPGAPLDAVAGGAIVRDLLAFASSLIPKGLRAVQLDAAYPGTRPRELDRSGRRDLIATLRRGALGLSGLDLFIPPEHFLKPETLDRAVSGTLSALDLLADLRSPSDPAPALCMVLPTELPADVRSAITNKSRRLGVRVADCAVLLASIDYADAIGIGLDPAALFTSNQDPSQLAASLGPALAAARLSDVASGIGAVRIAPGSPAGRLDLTAYLIALATTRFPGAAIIDPRGIHHQRSGIQRTLEACSAIALPPVL
jgi:hypothetical protein